MKRFTEKLNMVGLSDDAKTLAGAWFSRMGPDSDGVTLHLRESQPSPRTQAALDELLNWGAISRAPFNRYGGLVYKPLVDCFEAFVWFAKLEDKEPLNWPIMEPISKGRPS